MRRLSIRERITAVGILTLALFIGFGAWATVQLLNNEVDRDVESRNAFVLDAVAEAIAGGADPVDFILPRGTDFSSIIVVDADGRILNSTFDDMVGSVIDPLTKQASLDDVRDGRGVVRQATTPDGATLTLLSEAPLGSIGQSLDSYTWIISLLVPVLIALGGMALWLAVGAALRPVQQMMNQANRIDLTTSGTRLRIPESNDEITQLAVTLNGMLDRLDSGLVRQRQFVSDASHELRSPLTAVRGASELLDDRDLSVDQQLVVAAIRRGARRLELILDDLTELADAAAPAMRNAVDLDVVVISEAEAVRANHPDVEIDTSRVVPAVVSALETQLARTVQNLVSNAARHAERRVQVTATADDDYVRIVVDDDGPGVPVDDRERIFERFVRLDEDRSRSVGGAGLGLALVAAIAEAHGGDVVCAESPLGGARFVVQWPRTYDATSPTG